MKSFKTILSGVLIVFMLISSISHAVNVHLCGGEINNVAIFSQAQKCTMYDSDCDEARNVDRINQKGCCEDATIVIDSDKYLSKIRGSKIFDSHQIFVQPASIIQTNLSYADLLHTQYSSYKPPIISRDITILLQSFLI